MNPADTVVAISSPPGAAPRGIVRITGADAFAVARRVLRGLPDGRPRAGAHLALGLDLPGWPLVEDVLALLFVAPRSYTGDDLVELHLPGCGPLLEATVEALLATDERERVARTRVRAAGPGEFTWRAVLNGRLDVAQAEAVGELVAAPDAVAAARCVAGLVPAAAHSASLASRAAAWREALAQMLARTELALDFSDDEDLTYVADPPGMQAALRDMLAAMQAAGAGSATPGSGSPHTGLPDVVLAGPANAGKSSLFNRLVASSRATRALVTRHAGTTRDATCAELDDPPMRLWDTAGLRGANDGVDASAEGLSLALATSCDLVVWCWSADMPDWQPPPFDASRCVVLQTRADLPAAWPLQSGAMAVSARTGAGLDALRAAVRERLAGREVRSSATFANARQSAHLHAATAAVSRALPLAGGGRTLELAAAELGEADRELAALLGVEPATGVASEQILQRIFAGFCVGK